MERITINKETTLAEIKSGISTINKAITDGDLKAKNLAQKNVSELVESFNIVLRQDEYDKWLATETPMRSAIKQGEVTQIALKRIAEKEDGTPEKFELNEDKKVLVDIREFNDFADHQLYVSGQWIYKIEILAKYLNMRVMEDVENKEGKSTVEKTYFVSKEAQALGFSMAKPTSNASLKSAMQEIVNDIVGDDCLIKNKDVKHMLLCMTGTGKNVVGLREVKTTTITGLLTREMHRVINGYEYTLDLKK